MNSKFYFNWLFSFVLLTVVWCLAEHSDCKSLQSVANSAYDLPTDTHPKYEASGITLQGDAIIEIAAYEPSVYSISRINLFFHASPVKAFQKSVFNTPDINLLSLIRKDNLFLSILRI